MKKIILFLLVFITICSSCKKNTDNTWTDEEKASYQAVISLQEQAAENYTTWMQTMDSLDVLAQLQQFFLSDPAVLSASINSQGIMVEYANGMGGGFFLNPEDQPGVDSVLVNNRSDMGRGGNKITPVVNYKQMILLNPHYWDRFELTDPMISNYNTWLPKQGLELAKTYLNDEADIDQFTNLSGYGIVQIYTHGMAWPDRNNIKKVYIYTGEEENEITAEKYYDELLTREIRVCESESLEGTMINRYFISDHFLIEHNDFHKDTVLFIGSFCYSFFGEMPEIQKSFAAGTYVGFDWSVNTAKNVNWTTNLVTSMVDGTFGYPLSSAWWFNRAEMLGTDHYFDQDYERDVYIKSTGDTTYLWKTPPPEVEIAEATELSSGAAKLNAKVNPHYAPTNVVFEYGLTADYGKTVVLATPFSWDYWQDVSAEVYDLLAQTTYHYRIRAKSDMGTTLSDDITFQTTAAGIPTAITQEATNVTALTATLNGTINPHGVTAYGEFEYGLTTEYGSLAAIAENPLNGDEQVTLSANINNLVSGQTYHFRMVAYHQGYVDIVYGEDMKFVAVEGAVQVGQEYQGGIVFAVEPNGLHGLIAAPYDQSPVSGVEWGCYHTAIPGADGTEYGTGRQNTTDILNGCHEPNTAAQLCDNLLIETYHDWYLPSSMELYSLYLARDIVGGFNLNGGWYWSSSESSADQAIMIPFNDGVPGGLYKDQKILVRAIRSF